MCCYDSSTIRGRFLVENKDKFQTVDADGNDEIDERYYLIQSILPYFAATKNIIADGHFMDEAMDTEPCLRAFKKIFEIME